MAKTHPRVVNMQLQRTGALSAHDQVDVIRPREVTRLAVAEERLLQIETFLAGIQTT